MNTKDYRKLYVLDVYIGLRIINNYSKYFGHMHQNYIPIIDFSFQDSNIKQILYALDSLDRLEVFDKARFVIPAEGFPKELQERINTPNSYYFTWAEEDKENMWDLEYTAFMLSKEQPEAIDKGRCGFWCNNKKMKTLRESLEQHIKAYISGNLPAEARSSKLSYLKQKEKILKFLEEEYRNNCDITDPMIYVEVKDSRLKEVDVIRALVALSFEKTGEVLKTEEGYEYNEKFLSISDIINKRQKWTGEADSITIFVKLSHSLATKFTNLQKKQDTISKKSVVVQDAEIPPAGNFSYEGGSFSYKDALITGDKFLLEILFELMKNRNHKINLIELHKTLCGSKKVSLNNFKKYPSSLNKVINESISNSDDSEFNKQKINRKFVYVQDGMCILNAKL